VEAKRLYPKTSRHHLQPQEQVEDDCSSSKNPNPENADKREKYLTKMQENKHKSAEKELEKGFT